jgi:ABC-2 type transport system permease protein/oleandomycin transport system permease protein
VLFVYVFGGAIETPGFDYVDFLMPGIIVQSMVFGGFVTALGLAEDLKKGLIDRFRSLPMARSAVLTGRTLADVATNVVQLVVMLAVALVGFRFSSSAPEVVGGSRFVLIATPLLGPRSSDLSRRRPRPERLRLHHHLPARFALGVRACRVDAELAAADRRAQPVTAMVDAVRALFLGIPAGNSVWLAVAWSFALIAVFGGLSSWRYRRAVGR